MKVFSREWYYFILHAHDAHLKTLCTSFEIKVLCFYWKNISSSNDNPPSMEIWLETVDLSLIERGVRAGLVQGIIAPPSPLLQNPQEVLKALLAAQPGPVVVDIYSDFEEKGRQVTAFSSRIIPRIPAIEEAWPALHQLSKNKIRVMAGAVFSPTHALLAARTGAHFIVPHLSRMIKTGERPFEQIESIQKIINNYQLSTSVMALHPKSHEQIKVCAEIGLAGVIVRDDLYKELLESHELAAFHCEQSQADWKKFVELFFSNE
jgi:transaldolase